MWTEKQQKCCARQHVVFQQQTIKKFILVLEYGLRVLYNESFRVQYISHDLNTKPFFCRKCRSRQKAFSLSSLWATGDRRRAWEKKQPHIAHLTQRKCKCKQWSFPNGTMHSFEHLLNSFALPVNVQRTYSYVCSFRTFSLVYGYRWTY